MLKPCSSLTWSK
ncbi:hypothetical protein D018_1340A, partial [Vibrio parahaemolyticus VP2007-007]